MNLKKAYSHIITELHIDNLKDSLRLRFEEIRKVHDAIHEFILIAPAMFPCEGVSWHSKSAFLLYHWETFDSAHRSLIEALCGYYNVAFTLLRSVLELLLKGAFFERLAHRKFRENSSQLDKDKGGRNLKTFLNEITKQAPSVADELERISASIYDKIALIVDNPKFRPRIKTIIKQLKDWEILDPIPNADLYVWNLYQILSKDVHVIPDRIYRQSFST